MVGAALVQSDCLFDECFDGEEVLAYAVDATLSGVEQVCFEQNDLFGCLSRVEERVVDVVHTP